ncbi:MAG: rhomboid family intramembrane serine protease [Lachnospiraceae bacterium]|nr:rhomboid family intramembrane serine protease [Lachnospiraceae bacterium]
MYEGQEDFDSLRSGLEDILYQPFSNKREPADGQHFTISPCNTLLVTANILIFFLCEIFGSTLDTEFLLEHGALNYQRVVVFKEYYRLFSYMFLHGGIQHLFNNMLILWFLGDNLEKQMGHVKYLFLYFASGILAGFASMSYNGSIGRFVVCVGASGAIFGVSGALAYIVLVNRGHVENLKVRQMLLFIALSLYGGFSSQGVDNVAHVGGLVAGVFLALLLYRKKIAGSRPTAEKRLD